MTGRGRGVCRGGPPAGGVIGQIAGSLALGLLAWGGRALGRRLSAGPALPPSESRFSLETLPDAAAIGTGDADLELAEMQRRARTLERDLEALRARIRTLETGRRQ
jgi:hypothetical protein